MKHLFAKNRRARARSAAFALLFAAVGLLVLPGCRNPFNQPEDTTVRQGTVSLTIDARDSATRTIAPVWPTDALRFSLRFDLLPEEANTVIAVADWTQGSTVYLYAGRWSLTVHVYRTVEASEYLIATGFYPEINVEPGRNTGANLTLLPSGGGTGTFTWEITVPDTVTVDAATMGIYLLNGMPVYSRDLTAASGAIVGDRNLPADVYRVVFRLTNAAGEGATISEILHIHRNLTSHFSVTNLPAYFPTSLLNIILRAWDNYGVANAEGNAPGSIGEYLFAVRGLRAGHFGLLEPRVRGLDAPGFDAGDFPAFLGWFDTLAREGSQPGPRPGNVAELKVLVDAALIGVGGAPFGVAPGTNWADAESAVLGELSANETPVSLTRTRGLATKAFVGSGEHGYSVPIAFDNPVYDFTVRFHPNGSTGVQQEERVYAGHLLTLRSGEEFTRTNYVFAGWNTLANGGGRLYAGSSLLTVTGNLNLHAMLVRNDTTTPAPSNATVTFNASGGEGTQPSLTVPQGTEILLPASAFTRAGHVFTGWGYGTGTHPVGAPFVVAGNTVLTARWEAAPEPVPFRTVTLRPNGGAGTVIVMTVPHGAEVTLPDGGFTRQWHELAGWALSALAVNAPPGLALGSGFTVTEDATLHAVWRRPQYRVTFDTNNGTGPAPEQMSALYGTTIPLPGSDGFDKPGFVFTGWNTQPDGLGVHLAGSHFIVTGDTRLYARWVSDVAAPVTVTYRPGPGATGDEHVDYTFDGTIVLLSADFAGFSKTYHVIIGWRTQDGHLLLGGAPFLVTSDIVLYAEWLRIEFDDDGAPIPVPAFTVTLIDGDEEVSLTPVPHGTAITLPGEGFSREGYVMTGWSRDAAATADHYALGGAFTVTGNVTLHAVWRPITVTNMTINPGAVSLIRGQSQTFTVTVTGEHNPQASVSWEITGADGGTVHVPGPVVGNTVTVTLNTARDQTWGENRITIRANSLVTAGRYAIALVTVDPPSVVDVEVTGPAAVHRTETPRFTAEITSSTGYAASENFTWRLEGDVTDGTTISNDPGTRGEITFAATQIPGTVTVVAESAYYIAGGGRYSGLWNLTVLAPTVTGVTLTPAEHNQVRRGETVYFALAITGEGNPGADAAVHWAPVPTGRPGDPAIHSTTTASGNNTGGSVAIYPAPNQALGVINVQATVTNWAVTPGVGSNAGVASVTVLPPTELSVTVTPGPTHLMPRGDYLFTASVNYDAGHASQDVVWEIVSTDGQPRRPGTLINEHGRLFVPGRQLGSNIVIRATSIYDADVFIEVTVTYTDEPAVGRWRMINVGIDHTVALTWDNELYVWGRNQFGQLGVGNRTNRNVPTPVLVNGEARRDWVSVSGGWAHTVAVRADGTIWGAGEVFHSGHGAGGVRAVTFGDTLRQIGTDSNWRHIFASHSAVFGIREDGSLWSWGSNNSSGANPARGILGHGTAGGSESEPRRIGDRTDWASLSGSWTHVVAITNDGELFGWGSNEHGQLGRAAAAVVSTPSPMEGDAASLRWHSVAVGSGFTTGIRRDDANNANNRRLYLWGQNAEGVLGVTANPSVGANRISPARLGSEAWASINLNGTSHIVAIRGDNTLWSWGGTDEFGQLGRGEELSATARQTPTQITEGRQGSTPEGRPDLGDGADGSWNHSVPNFAQRHWVTSVAGGSFSFAIDVAGNLWGWGHNAYGMLGNELTQSRDRPVPIQPGWVPVD